ncbi:dihydroorotase [Algoriphagus halophytocola]|uniref:Dihydroorotase n=1 Tax=Algoriphagus halophytocola TaxID=2991499 RepID=A0ABY6MMC4_9BACT|nr:MULTISPECIES: dihydroorotase [unclassified Algoriphagus]UZD24694.1 dihydroorotase [Algoriphagus sp. TR-M5]WBL42062.1 dihydroorotase [Algoriphagus sp. TR-M9]
MSILFKGLRFVDSEGLQEPKDFVFDQGEMQLVESGNSTVYEREIDASGWLISKGWVDLRCGLGEPGYEYKESVETLADSLTASGFAAAVILPNTDPVLQSKSDVDFVLNRARKFTPEFIIQGAVTKDVSGEDFTEMLDVHYQSEVTVFGEGRKTLANADRYMKALQYLQRFDGVLFDHSYDPLLAIFGHMNEGEVSTKIGVKGIPNLADDVAIQRNLEIINYAGGKAHFQTINTKKSVELIRAAKKQGLQVTADVSIYQLLFTDMDLVDFDTNLKVMPPFRTESDRQALLQGLKDGTIDAIVSNHSPQDLDSKFMEFDLANFGMAGLQTFLPAMVKLEKELGWPLLISKITQEASSIIPQQLKESWTLFDPKAEWNYDHSSNKSLSSNSPWFGQTLCGQVKYVVQKGQLIEIDV